jgi:hypothetical protein
MPVITLGELIREPLDHHPNITSLLEAAETGCHLCTLLFNHLFLDILKKKKPLPAQIEDHWDVMNAVSLKYEYSTYKDQHEGSFYFKVHPASSDSDWSGWTTEDGTVLYWTVFFRVIPAQSMSCNLYSH